MSVPRRKSYEAGHKPKFLVVLDETEECDRAIVFTARRAARTGATMTMLAVTEVEKNQDWIAIGDIMQQEAEERAAAHLDLAATRVRNLVDIEAEQIIRSGSKIEQVLALIEADADIALLVVGASCATEGPGPLVTLLSGKAAGTFPVPVVVVPGGLSDEDIQALA
jgi:nucleotide-binding universal stress UspA family protein